MAKKRALSPKSVWDARELEAALAAQGVKALPRHIRKIYRSAPVQAGRIAPSLSELASAVPTAAEVQPRV